MQSDRYLSAYIDETIYTVIHEIDYHYYGFLLKIYETKIGKIIDICLFIP